MKANELRISNLVKDRGGKILRIDWFEINKVCQIQMLDNFEVHPLTEYFEYIMPIPLAEEWLLKFRFNEGYAGYYYIGDFIISVEGQVYFGETETWIAEIHFVHQLQNLYFALTGEELQILP